MCWCWGAFQAFYGIEASFIREVSVGALSALGLSPVWVNSHRSCFTPLELHYIYIIFLFCSIASTHRSAWQVKPSTINAGKWHPHTIFHACAFYLVGQSQSHAPSLQRNDLLDPLAAWVVCTAAKVVLDEVLGVMCLFFFF